MFKASNQVLARLVLTSDFIPTFMPWIHPAARVKPSTIGLHEGQLRPCPSTPNCVCSQAVIETQRLSPLTYVGTTEGAHAVLLSLLNDDPKANIVEDSANYIHTEYRAFIFIDDVEFFFPKNEKVIHFRSASRLGHSDLGANKRRMKAISAAFSLRQ